MSNNRKIALSNTDKEMFPEISITKRDVINYYQNISKYLLPHIKERPLTLQRYPDGISKDGFFQQNKSDYFPSWIDSIEIDKKDGDITNHVVCNQVDTLIYLANQAMITPHIWLSQVETINKPDKLIFDLDPVKNDLTKLVTIAKSIRDYLEKIELKVYVMNTGSSGLHIVVPIKPELKFDDVRKYAKKIAEKIVNLNTNIATTEQRIEKRNGKVFIDYLRNAYGQTSVTPYAIRALKKAPIATPLDWEELSGSFDPQAYTIKNIMKRMGQKKDPWEDIYKQRQSLKDAIKKL